MLVCVQKLGTLSGFPPPPPHPLCPPLPAPLHVETVVSFSAVRRRPCCHCGPDKGPCGLRHAPSCRGLWSSRRSRIVPLAH